MKKAQQSLQAIKTIHPVKMADSTKNGGDESRVFNKKNSAPADLSDVPATPLKNQVKFDQDQKEKKEEAEKTLSSVKSAK